MCNFICIHERLGVKLLCKRTLMRENKTVILFWRREAPSQMWCSLMLVLQTQKKANTHPKPEKLSIYNIEIQVFGLGQG